MFPILHIRNWVWRTYLLGHYDTQADLESLETIEINGNEENQERLAKEVTSEWGLEDEQDLPYGERGWKRSFQEEKDFKSLHK